MTPTVMNGQGNAYTRDRGQAGAERATLVGQSTQWMTPVVPNGGRTLTRDEVDAKGTLNGVKKTVPLDQQARYWPTPTAQADQGPDSSSRQGGPTLVTVTSSWPTPRASMGPGDSGSAQRQQQGPNPGLHAAAAAWPTPMAADSRGSAGTRKHELPNVAQAWSTPASRDYRTPNLQSYEERGGEGKGEQLANFVVHQFSLPAPTAETGRTFSPRPPGSPPPSPSKESKMPRLLSLRLNPYFVEWLMGWPMGWTSPIARGVYAAQETASWHCALQQHLSCLLGAPGSSRGTGDR